MRSFIRGCWRLIKLYFIWVGALVTIMSILLTMSLSSLDLSMFSEDDEKPLLIPATSGLVEVELSGTVYERYDYRGPSALFNFLNDSELLKSYKNLKEQLQLLQSNSAIEGVLFHVRPNFYIHSNYAMDLLAEFKLLAEKKPVYFFGALLQDGTNYLMSDAREIILAPGGALRLPSPIMAQLLLGKVMERFGVGLEVIKAGHYKNFVLHLDEVDPANKRQMLSVYDSYLKVLSDYMKEARLDLQATPPITTELIDEWFRQSDYGAQEALRHQLVTQVGHLQPFKDQVANETSLPWYKVEEVDLDKWTQHAVHQKIMEMDEPQPQAGNSSAHWQTAAEIQPQSSAQLSAPMTTPSSYSAPTIEDKPVSWFRRLWSQDDKTKIQPDSLGYLSFYGTIMLENGESSTHTITERQVEQQVDVMLEYEHVKAVVIRINSPGGGVLASELIWSEIKRLSAQKPTVAYIDNMAASGGYYIATATNQIVARPTAITGSIGVLLIRPHIAGLAKNYGIKMDLTTRQNYADIFDPTQKLSTTTKAYLQQSVQDSYNLFLGRVAENRDMTQQQVHERLAQGRIWTGEQAHQVDLIDILGNRRDAFKVAKQLAGLDPLELYPVEFARKKIDFLKICLASLSDCLRMLQSSSRLPTNQAQFTETFLFAPKTLSLTASAWRAAHQQVRQKSTELIQAHLYLALPFSYLSP